MKLPYPFMNGDLAVVGCELKTPTGGTIADARKCAEKGDVYQALHAYVAGSIASLETEKGESIEGKDQVKTILRGFPWGMAEWIAFQSMIYAGAVDEIDMPFTCPRCGFTRYRDNDLVRVGALEMKQSDTVPACEVILPKEVEFKDANTGEVIESISTLQFRLPTIGDCIRAAGNVGMEDDTRLQFAIWAEAITHVNGNAIDQKWRGPWGAQTFERMEIKGIQEVGKALGAWSLDNTIASVCPKCGKKWRQEVPTGSFFASALKGS